MRRCKEQTETSYKCEDKWCIFTGALLILSI